MAPNTKTVAVGTASAAPGKVARGRIEVTSLPGGGGVGMPVIVINGREAGPCLWVDAAIHGDEPEGTLACHLLNREVAPDALAGTLVLVPAMNVGAWEAGRRGNPADTFSHDMNRIYPGKADGYLTERVAWAHAEWLKKTADFELSIHSGGEHSYLSETIFSAEDPKCLDLAKAMGAGWELVFGSPNPKGNPMATMMEVGKAGITVELGGRSATGPRDFHRVGRVLADAALNVLRHYKMIAGAPTYAKVRYKGFQTAMLAPCSGMFLPEQDVAFQKPMKKGDKIAAIYSLYGDKLAELAAPGDGVIFGLRALPSVTTGDWCCFFGNVTGQRDD